MSTKLRSIINSEQYLIYAHDTSLGTRRKLVIEILSLRIIGISVEYFCFIR